MFDPHERTRVGRVCAASMPSGAVVAAEDEQDDEDDDHDGRDHPEHLHPARCA